MAEVDHAPIADVALDEMYSQGRPVLAGIDLESQFLFLLEARESRTGEDWAEALGELRDQQGLDPQCVVKDGGSGLEKGTREVFPEAQRRDDLFHAKQPMVKVASLLERRAYAHIARVDALQTKREAATRGPESLRRSLGQQLMLARRREAEAIEDYDRFEALRQEAERVLEIADRGSGRLRRSEEVVEVIERVAEGMVAHGDPRARALGIDLRNRAAGLASYLDDLGRRLHEITEEAGGQAAVEAAIRAYQASLLASREGPRWDARARQREVREATRELVEVAGGTPAALLNLVSKVFPLLANRNRASSAIENLNSVLRPYLVVQKSTSRPFLDLFRFYWNTRIREWGPHKGTSAYEQLTGEHVGDWLTLLGYPPGQARARAA